MILKNVVLPEPFGPMMATIEPGMTSRSMRFTALMPPNDFAKALMSSSGVAQVDRTPM